MHASKFSLIVVLSCIAMIGAIPVGDGAAAETIVRRQGLGYVPYQLQLQYVEVSNLVKQFLH
jgi:hypothetical protein